MLRSLETSAVVGLAKAQRLEDVSGPGRVESKMRDEHRRRGKKTKDKWHIGVRRIGLPILSRSSGLDGGFRGEGDENSTENGEGPNLPRIQTGEPQVFDQDNAICHGQSHGKPPEGGQQEKENGQERKDLKDEDQHISLSFAGTLRLKRGISTRGARSWI